MTEEEMERSVRRGKVFNYTAFGILVLLLLCAGIWLIKFHNDHTFTTEKWMTKPDSRALMLENLLTDHPLVGLTQEEVVALLGPEDQHTSTFGGKLEEIQQGDLLLYYLGMDFMEERWLVLNLKENRVVNVVCDVT